ncbi:hypothetical protein [Kineosporia succinea]|uniref:Uncharacterized protein YecT (DUF1311 family) n=1 Tax=Kineosporia succinea TaxID=84632 RepID=A0ABT9P291_9ACTN|nr:hypothetical protein [Kineosporia succinea]MDP9826792.1 uncharacterized protein YecT (DUF1311 family) [Kineosporia succinea]
MTTTRRYAPFVAAAGVALLAGAVAAGVVLDNGDDKPVVTSAPTTLTSPGPSKATGTTENVSGTSDPETTTSVVGVDAAPVSQTSSGPLKYQPLTEPFLVPVENCDPKGTYQEVANCYLAEAVAVDEKINRLQEIEFLGAGDDSAREELLTRNETWLDDRQKQTDQVTDQDEAVAVTSAARLFLKLSNERLAAVQPGQGPRNRT